MRAGTLRRDAPGGEADHEPGAADRRVAHVHGAAVTLRDGAHHRPPEPRAATVAAATPADPREPVEHPPAFLGWHPGAVVVDDEAHLPAPRGHVDRDAAARV